MRTIWNGSISFGLVNIPIGLALATQRVGHRRSGRCTASAARRSSRSAGARRTSATSSRTSSSRAGSSRRASSCFVEDVRPRGGRAAALAVDRDPRASSSSPTSTRCTSTARTTSRPRRRRPQRRPYVLLLRAMQETGMAAIGKFVLWGKENLCLIRPHGDSLALETLFFAEDVRSRAEIEEAVAETEVKDGGARPRPAGDRQPRRASSTPRSSRTSTGASCARCSRRSSPARRSSSRSRSPETPVVDLMEALRAERRRGARRREARRPRSARPRRRRRAHAPRAKAPNSAQSARPRARRRARPSPASCAWNRVLSILPW